MLLFLRLPRHPLVSGEKINERLLYVSELKGSIETVQKLNQNVRFCSSQTSKAWASRGSGQPLTRSVGCQSIAQGLRSLQVLKTGKGRGAEELVDTHTIDGSRVTTSLTSTDVTKKQGRRGFDVFLVDVQTEDRRTDFDFHLIGR